MKRIKDLCPIRHYKKIKAMENQKKFSILKQAFRLMKESDYLSPGKPRLELNLQPAKHKTRIIMNKNYQFITGITSKENTIFWKERQTARTTKNFCAYGMKK